MKLIVGLGNPGNEYAATRHNVGFMVVDRLAGRVGMSTSKAKFHARVFDGAIGPVRCYLMEPMTFMNRSGLSVGEAVVFYKLDPSTDLLVVVDDVALPAGRIRLRAEGGSGGHNGLKDIERVLGTQSFSRLRVGIDSPGKVRQADYVLSRFTPDQIGRLDLALDQAVDAIICWVEHDITKAMNRYNSPS